MAQFFSVHPEQPQPRLIRQAAELLREGGVLVIPTDSTYALAVRVGNADALERLRRIRRVDERHHLTLMCRDLSEIARYARVDNAQYRLLKSATPGSYTFILEGTKELPRRVLHPKRKTIGLRIPQHPVVQLVARHHQAGGIQEHGLKPGAVQDPQSVAPGGLRLARDDGEAFLEQAVHQGRFAHVRWAHQGDVAAPVRRVPDRFRVIPRFGQR